MNTMECHNCGANLPSDADNCSECGTELAIAELVSRGTGVIPSHFVWTLRPGSHSVGRGIGNTFIIPSAGVPANAAQIVFDNSERRFYIDPLTVKGVHVNGNELTDRQKLVEGDTIRIVSEEFEFHLNDSKPTGAQLAIGPQAGAGADDQVANALAVANSLQRTLAYISEFHNVPTLNELAEKLLDAVLEVTKTRRGFFFLLRTSPDSDDVRLEELTARAAGGVPLKASSYDISHSFLQRALEGRGTVLVQDAVRENALTNTMRKHQLRAVVCVPIVLQNEESEEIETAGILYADNFLPTHDLPTDCATALRMFAQVASFKIRQWRDQERRQALLENQAELLANISKQMGTLSKGCEAAQAAEPSAKVTSHLSQMQQALRTIETDLARLTNTTATM